jgi:hypothetical protein
MTNPPTNQPSHTPTPWTFNNGLILGPETPEEQPVIAQVYGTACEDQQGHANAALIVRAVNAHDGLVAACQRALKYGRVRALDVEELELLQAALSKAGGVR